jgi:hypothetical protein
VKCENGKLKMGSQLELGAVGNGSRGNVKTVPPFAEAQKMGHPEVQKEIQTQIKAKTRTNVTTKTSQPQDELPE